MHRQPDTSHTSLPTNELLPCDGNGRVILTPTSVCLLDTLRLQRYFPGLSSKLGPPGAKLSPPTPKQETLLRQIALAGLVDRVARLDEDARSLRAAYKTLYTDESVMVHAPCSLIAHATPEPRARELARSSQRAARGRRYTTTAACGGTPPRG